MAKSWSDFFNWVLPHVPGCPQRVAEDAIREAAIAFCDQTLVYKRTLTLDAVAGGTGLYDLAVPVAAQLGDQVEVLAILDGHYNGDRIYPKTDLELAQQYGDTWDTTTGVTRWFNQFDEFTARFTPIPDTAITGGLVLALALVPAKTASEFDDGLWKSYHIEIANAAVASLMMSTKKPYTNLSVGAARTSRFSQDCNTVAANKKNNYTRRPLRSTAIFR